MSVEAKRWNSQESPKRILVIRLQAMGDVVITLPYIQYLKASLPKDTIIDMLTRQEVNDIPKAVVLFDHVFSIGGGRSFKKQLVHALLLLPKLCLRRYDVVIDLQNNLLSRFVRKSVSPKAWSEFDRFSPQPAGERNRITIEAAGMGKNDALTSFHLKSQQDIPKVLLSYGWDTVSDIVILNPAGAFENRNWPVDNYIQFAWLWLQCYPATQFLILGIDKIAAKAATIKSALGTRLIDLVNKTTPSTAFAIVQRARFVLSEDSGLMHMAWVSGIPTFAIFGSTRSDWSRPLGAHTAFLDSSDMACGNCMLEICRLEGDKINSCMMRYSPQLVFEKAVTLLDQQRVPDTSS
jgi:ADP-heptose:LPS heptosyltransferase